MLIALLAIITLAYIVATALLIRGLRSWREGQKYAGKWLAWLLLCSAWVIISGAMNGGWLWFRLIQAVTSPNFDPWATTFISLVFSSIWWLPLIPVVALLSVPPPVKVLVRAPYATCVVIWASSLAWLHFANVQTVRFSVIDQDGNPVPDAVLRFVHDGFKDLHTDLSGRIELHFYPASNDVQLLEASKSGYVFHNVLWPHEQGSPVPSRVVVSGWKIKERSRMIECLIYGKIPADGQWHYVNLLRCDVSDAPQRFSDLKVRLQSAMGPKRPLKMFEFDHEEFPWRMDVECINGGCRLASDEYKYMAPEKGYATSYGWEHTGPSYKTGEAHEQHLYLRLRGGKAYALAEFTTPTKDGNFVSGVSIKGIVNPTASRSLLPSDVLAPSRSETRPWLQALFGDDW